MVAEMALDVNILMKLYTSYRQMNTLKSMLFNMVCFCCIICFLTSCTATVENVERKQQNSTLIKFLKNGHTKKREVIDSFGQPSRKFSHDRIFTYRILSDENGLWFISLTTSDNWINVHHSLVLVFDDNNVLKKYSLIRIR